jgi:hypothetical protein
VRILLWHVHGSWTTAFVQGTHDYVLPVTPDRGPDGLGRARTWSWPASVHEASPEQLAGEPFDLVLLQRPHETELAARWLGRRPGIDLPAIYVEHNAPPGPVPDARHPLAERSDIPVVHVTHFNDLFWDNGRAPHFVVEHGIIDPGHTYSGELDRLAVVVNDPLSRGRTVGTDLLPRFAASCGVDVFGMRVQRLGAAPAFATAKSLACHEDLPQEVMHRELARRRVYLHLMRWTSLGLALIEAMTLGMPVVALAATDAIEAVPAEAGFLSTDVDRLLERARCLLLDPAMAREVGAHARKTALSRYGLGRFLADWDSVLKEVVR